MIGFLMGDDGDDHGGVEFNITVHDITLHCMFCSRLLYHVIHACMAHVCFVSFNGFGRGGQGSFVVVLVVGFHAGGHHSGLLVYPILGLYAECRM